MITNVQVCFFSFALLLTFGSLGLSGCGGVTQEQVLVQAEVSAQQLGEVLQSIDEFSQSSGNLTSSAFLSNPNLAVYSTCLGAGTWSSCEVFGSDRKRTKTFNGCTLGPAVLTGTIDFKYSGSSCALSTNGQTVSRSPEFSINMNGASINVQKVGTNGQVVTRTSAITFSFESDGIRRQLVSQGLVLSNFTTATGSAITIVGALRAGRFISGGSLVVTNNLSGVTCTYIPTAVTWTATCTCPTSGTWSFTCSDSSNGNISHSGCDQVSVLEGAGGAAAALTVKFNRCVGT